LKQLFGRIEKHMASIDLDQNATTPLDPAVLEAMSPYFLAGGNPESRHSLGRAARRGLERSRESIAHIMGGKPAEVIFTSGGTEANNLAIFGLASIEPGPSHLIASPFEHPAVSEPISRLDAMGSSVDRLTVTREGIVDLSNLANLIRPDTRLATLMLANNETGAIQPVRDLSERLKSQDIFMHTDAVQAVGRIPVNFLDLGVTTLAASAHKFHGPPGVGFLMVQDGFKLPPTLHGGGQQRGLRPGTPPVALIVGMAAALQEWHKAAEERTARWRTLRDRLEAGLINILGPDKIHRNGPISNESRLPQTLNLGFSGFDGDALLIQFDLSGISVSLGSACSSGATTPSATLLAMGVAEDRLRSSVRFSLGAFTNEDEINQVIERVQRSIALS
jgi:cysteine desulfurase